MTLHMESITYDLTLNLEFIDSYCDCYGAESQFFNCCYGNWETYFRLRDWINNIKFALKYYGTEFQPEFK